MSAFSPRATDRPSPAAARPRPGEGDVEAGHGTDPAPDHWLLLADAGDPARPARQTVRPRHVALQVGIAVLVVVSVVGLGGALVSRHVAQQQAVHDVAELTDVLAQSVLQPALTDAMLTDPTAARRVLDPLVRARVLSPALVRVKLWTPRGTVLYSDDARLIGRSFALDPEARTALTTPQTEASISDLGRPENMFERSDGTLLEVYRPVWTPSGRPLLFETYFRYGTVSQRSRGLWRGFAGIILSSLVALLLLLLPVVWALLQRTRRAQEQRQAMMQRAIASSDAERARIAASLHDGVVQQLVASSFELAGRAERAAASGDERHAEQLRGAATTIRRSIGGLRSVLVDIYPPNLAAAGLPAALRDLAGTLAGGRTQIVLDLDDEAIDRLGPAATEAVFRVVQEALRNAAKHAADTTVTVRVQARPGEVLVEIDDDGQGFDAATLYSAHDGSVRDGHLGLQLMTDAARQAGADLRLASRPGYGTHYRMEVPAP